jgi:glycosyltransferase involved in cell wall biosynthesis
MDFDIVMVTRNRQRALEICVPLILSQERRPARFIVVDASDDHQSVCSIVEQAAASAGGGCDLQIVPSDPGMTYRRNLSLKHVTSPVIMFPDDDALWLPGVASAIMAIYEGDTEGLTGGVGGEEWPEPPPGALIGNKSTAWS